jgi:hypothetical protein
METTKKEAAVKAAAEKVAEIFAAHEEGADLDAGFDGGEFSRPAHHLAAEREARRACEVRGVTLDEVWTYMSKTHERIIDARRNAFLAEERAEIVDAKEGAAAPGAGRTLDEILAALDTRPLTAKETCAVAFSALVGVLLASGESALTTADIQKALDTYLAARAAVEGGAR